MLNINWNLLERLCLLAVVFWKIFKDHPTSLQLSQVRWPSYSAHNSFKFAESLHVRPRFANKNLWSFMVAVAVFFRFILLVHLVCYPLFSFVAFCFRFYSDAGVTKTERRSLAFHCFVGIKRLCLGHWTSNRVAFFLNRSSYVFVCEILMFISRVVYSQLVYRHSLFICRNGWCMWKRFEILSTARYLFSLWMVKAMKTIKAKDDECKCGWNEEVLIFVT